ncbi:hypothetical protein C3952_03920 [Lactococcus lactis]|nr:hypothetical protein C3952_03920 [Lactococcus lactis]
MIFWKNKKKITQEIIATSNLNTENIRLKSENVKLKNDLKICEKQKFNLTSASEITNRNMQIVRIFTNTEEVYTVGIDTDYNYKGQLTSVHFYLYLLSDRKSPPYWYNHIWLEPYYKRENDMEWLDYIKITEFLGKTGEVGMGYGSYNFKTMLDFVQNNFGQRTKIKGWLSSVDERDENNKKRRNHVYEKFGFSIVGEWAILDEVGNRKI